MKTWKPADKDKFMAHFPQLISKSLVKHAINVALKHSRYIFTHRIKHQQFGYCTHCNSEFATQNLKHLSKSRCPNCKSQCQVRSSGMSRKYMHDKAVFVWYEKSVSNPKAITARIISVARVYNGDYRNVETGYNCCHMYLFEPGNSEYYQLGWDIWEKRSSTYSAFDNHYSGNSDWHKSFSHANVTRAVRGTPFQYCTWEQYTKFKNEKYVSDMVEFFDLAARYPCIEYLSKAGFKDCIWAKLYKDQTFGAIHWNGKTLQKVLRLSKTELNEARHSGFSFGPRHLRYFQKSRKQGLPTSLTDSYILADIDNEIYQDYYNDVLKLAPAEKILKYMLSQIRKGYFKSATSLLIDWRDYQRQCKKLGMSLSQERYLFPNNLHEAHKKNTGRIKLKEDKKLNIKIAARLPQLEKFRFEYRGLFLRPATSSIELFEEGKAQDNCVGDYAGRYANAQCDMFFVRRVKEPDKPFYTMSMVRNKVQQCRGYDNCDMTPEVRKFVDMFISKKFVTITYREIDTTGIRPENRQEAVV